MKNQLKAGAVLSYINMAIGALIPMFYTPIMLNLLGQEEYGLYKLSSNVTSYLSLISFGIGSAMVRYLTKYRFQNDKDGEERMLGLFNIIFSIIALVTVIVGFVLSFGVRFIYDQSLTNNLLIKMRILVFLLSINTALSFLFSPYTAVVNCHERFIFLQFINIILTIIAPVINIVVLYLGFASIGMVCASIALNICVMTIYLLYVKRNIGIKAQYKNLPTNLLKEILIFSFWIFVANIITQLYNTTDTLIIGAIPALATTGVAIYNIGVTFNGMLTNFSVGILSVLTPSVNKLVFTKNDSREITDMMIRVGRLQCYIVSIVCTGFIVFGHQFLNLWVGSSYNDAYWVALFTMIPVSIPLIQNVALNVIIAQNKHRFRSLVFLAIAILNVVGTLFCVNRFGIIGASVVTGIAYVLGQGFVMNWYYWKKINIDIPRFWKNVGKLFILPVILCFVAIIVLKFINLNSWLYFVVGVIIYSSIFLFVNWVLMMNDYEKDIFRKPVYKVLSKIKK